MPSRFCVGAGALAVLGAACLAVVLFPGCGSGQKSLAREQSNLKPLALLYGRFAGQHRGQAPASEAEFKDWLKSLPKEQIASVTGGSTDVEGLFISARDKKPYVILYGSQPQNAPKGPGGAPVVMYEQEGVGGMRFVASDIGAVEEVDEARFKELVPSAK